MQTNQVKALIINVYLITAASAITIIYANIVVNSSSGWTLTDSIATSRITAALLCDLTTLSNYSICVTNAIY